jgi:FkbM family methyltransferase
VTDRAPPLGPSLRGALAAGVTVARHRPHGVLAAKLAFRLGSAISRRAPIQLGRLETGARIVLDLRDHAHRLTYFTGVHEPSTTALVHRLARTGWTFLDVGANAGYYALLAADLGGPSARVLAFEPNDDIAAMLRTSAGLSAMPNVEVLTAACGREAGREQLLVSTDPGNTGLSSLVAGLVPDTSEVTVNVVTVDAVCEARGVVPDVVKIDVEGHELAVLEGMEVLLSSGREITLIVELSDDPRRPGSGTAVLDLLREHGFHAHRIDDDGGLHRIDDVDGLRASANACFVRGPSVP